MKPQTHNQRRTATKESNFDDGAPLTSVPEKDGSLGPVVQSVISLTNSLRVISLTVSGDSIYIILIFFIAEKM